MIKHTAGGASELLAPPAVYLFIWVASEGEVSNERKR